MSTYELEDDNLYLRCLQDGVIRIRRITNPGEVVGTWEEYKVVNTMDDGLKVYNVTIFGPRLRELEAELRKYRFYVNRQGYCYARVEYGIGTPHRVNDFFNWSKYGVVPKITTIWNRCELQTNTIVIDYEKKEKEFEDMKLQLKEKDKSLHHLNAALELKDIDLIEKDKCIAKKDELLREKNDCIEKKAIELSEKEIVLSEKEIVIRLKDLELKDCKLSLEKRERELSILTTLWGKQLEVLDSSDSCSEGLTDKDRGLRLYKTCLEEKERELRKLNSQLCATQKRVNDLTFAINFVTSYVNSVNSNVHKEGDFHFRSSVMNDREYVSVVGDLASGSIGDEMAARVGVDIPK